MGSKRFKVQMRVSDAASKGFKRHQTMNKGLIKRNDRSFRLKNKYKHYKHTCLYEMNEQNDSKKDLLILMNERASQNRARRAFELTKLKLCYLFIK